MIVSATKYKKKIWQYKKRRKNSIQTTRRLSAKIRSMEACLYSREAREKRTKDKVDKLLNSVNDFFALDIRNKNTNEEHRIARNIYYKIGLELQLREVLICKKVNRSPKSATNGRSWLNKNFKKKPEIKVAYYNFKKYFETK